MQYLVTKLICVAYVQYRATHKLRPIDLYTYSRQYTMHPLGTVSKQLINILIMVALLNRADHYIFILSFVVVLLSSFFLA